MTYMLNNTVISNEKTEELINDLAAFPFDKNDYNLTIADRKKKYMEALAENKKIQISTDLFIKAE